MRPPATPPDPTKEPGCKGTTRGLRKRGLPLTPEPGEGGGCSLEARGCEEESRQKQRMVTQATGREETEGDKLGETSASWKVASRGGSVNRGPRAVKEAEPSLIPEDAVRKLVVTPTPKPFFPQLPLSLLYY